MAQPPTDSDDLEARLAGLHVASFGWACSCCAWNEADAEDVLQDVYLKVISGKASFDGRSGFRTWLFGVIRYTALERRRRVRSLDAFRERLATEVAAEAETGVPPEDGTEEEDRARALRSALRSLAARQREVVHLVFYEGMTIGEAAEVMAISIGSARVHYDRAKKRLRALLLEEAMGGGAR